ncbi:AAA family ATPase [Blastococcus sp. SYSU D01050]
MIGRGRALERIGEVLAGARAGRSGVLLVEGEAGVGKTALLRAAAARATGFTCLTATGVESEAAWGPGCLLELLGPLRRHLDEVPPTQAQALRSALGWGPPGGPVDRYLLAAGTLSVLAAAAEAAPVLVVVDDLQWVDAGSAAALLFAARRMHSDRVAVLLAQRSGAAPPGGVESLPLTGLTPAEAADLLAPEVAGPVARRLAAQLGGNPLALREVAARLTRGQRRGTEPLPAPLPVGPRLARVFTPAVGALSAGARSALLLLAASTDGRAGPVAAALAAAGEDPGACLDEAEEARLLDRRGDLLAFGHPLVRTEVERRATPAHRRAAQRALAGTAGGPGLRTWHLAHAVDGPDDGLADALVAEAASARAQRGPAAASAALERAAALTSAAPVAAARLAEAAAEAVAAGDVPRARALADRVLRGAAPPAARAQALLVRGLVEQYAGSVPAARDLLREAGDLAAGPVRVRALTELAVTEHRLGDVAGLRTAAAAIAAAADDADPAQRALAAWVAGVAELSGGDPATGRAALRRALATWDAEPALRDEPGILPLLLLAFGWLEDDALAAVPGIERRLRRARERGVLGVLVTALALTANGRAAFLGDHAGAFADAGEAAELAEELGHVADAVPAVLRLAWELAARGAHDEAARQVDRARALADRAGTSAVAAHLAITAASVALCRGDLAETARLLEARLAADGGVGSLGEPLGVAPLLVEAYAGLGRGAEAAALAGRYAAGSGAVLPSTPALVARCRGLTCADDDEAAAAFADALAAHALAPDRFETAHTRLLHGGRLRRAGRRRAAREQLTAAADEFAAMDLQAWVARAATELRATGRTARPRQPPAAGSPAGEPLTAQETGIAVLAARGLSNREIAATLFLSPKTVEHHLSAVYRKRGLRSRVELASAFPPSLDPGALQR